MSDLDVADNEVPENVSAKSTVILVLAAVVAILLLFGGIGYGGISLIARSMKSSDAYRTSVDYVRRAPPILADLGSPIEDGFYPSGRIAQTTEGGSADLSIGLEGPKGAGRAHLVLTRQASGWTIASAEWTHRGRVTTLVEAAKDPSSKSAHSE